MGMWHLIKTQDDYEIINDLHNKYYANPPCLVKGSVTIWLGE